MPLASTLDAEDWVHWRGTQRNDIIATHSGWNEGRWNLRESWKFSAGEGSSSPLVVKGQVFLTGWASGKDTITCLDANSGQVLWRQSYDAPRYGRHAVGDQGFYSGMCSTPEYDPTTGLLFTLGIDGELRAWNTHAKGKLVWRMNLYDEYKAPRRPEVAKRRRTRRDYGYTTSPLVMGDQLIVEVGSPTGNLVALDKRSGKQRWISENKDEAGHTGGIVPIDVEGTPCVAVLTLRNLVVTRIDPQQAGATVATYPWTTDFGNNIPTPAVSGNSIVITTSYNHAAMCRLRISSRGAEKVWERSGIQSGVCSPVIHDGHIYWAWRGIHCVDFETGEKRWSGGKIGSPGSCVVTSDDRLVVFGSKGTLSLVETAKRSPDQYRQLSTRKVLGRTDAWPHVVLAGEYLLCRDRSGAVQCFLVDIGARETK